MIVGSSGAHRFDVEIAATPEQQKTGMMFRRNVPPNAGMLFPYDPPQYAAFWMKNTYAPLDLIFIGEDRRVSSIIAEAEPMSLDMLMATAPVIAVLEIRGGRAAELGIQAGDRVNW